MGGQSSKEQQPDELVDIPQQNNGVHSTIKNKQLNGILVTNHDSTKNKNHNINRSNSNSNNYNCTPCFFFGDAISKQLKIVTGGNKNKQRSTFDPVLGTPLPDTPPLFQRRQNRGENNHSIDLNNPRNDRIFSSIYLGMEKEQSSVSIAESLRENILSSIQNDNNNTNMNNSIPKISDDIAQIYEGADAEEYLHKKYEMMEVLGIGSTSTVHRCICRTTHKEYACKVIDCALIEDRFQGMMTQFHVEIDTLRQLQHPSIIRLYDVYLTDHKIFIVMELMEGGELFDYVVQKGTLTEEEASKIVNKVTSALVFMHHKNIVHRDLKPENLLLKHKPGTTNSTSMTNTTPTLTSSINSSSSTVIDVQDLDVKIIDFGLSKAMEQQQFTTGTFLGTRGYLAPEMLQRRDYTRAVDTWALGIIVFVLLCGCLPFDDDSSALTPSDDIVRAKFVLRFPRWAKNLSSSAKDLLSHLLDVNPRTRYTAEQALNHPWVRGETAKRDQLLASPGRIAKSPNLSSSIRNSSRVGQRKQMILSPNTTTNTIINNRQQSNNYNSPTVPTTTSAYSSRKYIPVDPSTLTPPIHDTNSGGGVLRQASL